MKLVTIGRIVRAVGLGGEVGVGGTGDSLATLRRIVLRRPGAPDAPREVVAARPQGRIWAVRLDGVSGRDAAEGLVGSEVLAAREDLGEAGEGLHFWGDLEGLTVVTASGEPVGKVSGLLETGAVDVLIVVGERGETLVPLAPYVTVDRAAGRVVVDPPEGLLELGKRGGDEGGPERGG